MSEKKYTEYVCGFYFDHKFQQVVLIWKHKPDWQKGKLNGVGGKIEKGELPITAMRREFHEETGILHNEWVDLVVLTGDDWCVYFFCTIGKVTEFEYVETQEEEEVAKIEVGRLHEYDHIPNLEWLVPMAINKLAYPDEQMTFYGQKSPAEQPVREVEFAEWILVYGYEPSFGKKWVDYSKKDDNRLTTAQLWELFKKERPAEWSGEKEK